VAHLTPTQYLAAGLHPPPSVAKPFAAVQASWRFYANPRLTLPQLAGPMLDLAREALAAGTCVRHALVVLDWCPLHLSGQDARTDQVMLSRPGDRGYDLLSALLLSDRDGSPVSPLCLELRSPTGSTAPERIGYSSRSRTWTG